MSYSEITQSLITNLDLDENYSSAQLELLDKAGSPYLKDLKLNIKAVLKDDVLQLKELYLLGVALASNLNNKILLDYFINKAESQEAKSEEIAEMIACASLLSVNNVLYRFRHLVAKEKYNQLPARLRMNIMMKPVTGKNFFELVSLAVSAVNGCEACIRSHEQSLMDLGVSEEKVFASIRLASAISGLHKVIN